MMLPNDVPPSEFRRVADECSASLRPPVTTVGSASHGGCAVRLRGTKAAWPAMRSRWGGRSSTPAAPDRVGRRRRSSRELRSTSTGDRRRSPRRSAGAMTCSPARPATVTSRPDSPTPWPTCTHVSATSSSPGRTRLAASRSRPRVANATSSRARRGRRRRRDARRQFPAAERILADACDWFIAKGNTTYVLEALHASALVDCGQAVDVERLAAMVEGRGPQTRALLGMAMADAHRAAG